MIRRRPDSGWRAMALATSLFAITLNFLQPLVHAAQMRDGPPAAAWTAFCNAAAAASSRFGSAPGQAAQSHECCLGLAHAQVLIEPAAHFLPVTYAHHVTPPPASELVQAAGIRDGPSLPRGPPTLA